MLLTAALASLLLAVPGLRPVLQELRHVGGGWLTLALVLELASCASFVVVFRHFFDGLPARFAQQLAWTEMGSGALLPGGGVGSLAVGGWLLHRVGMPTRQIVQRSSALFFLTSATSVATLAAGGLLLATGASLGPREALYAWLPVLAGTTVFAAAIGLPRRARRRGPRVKAPAWLGDLVAGVTQATRALLHPRWRRLGAIGYLGFDIAVLWATLTAIGYSPPLAVLILAYITGYLANIVPIPGGVGVLEAGLVGTLILYGADTSAAGRTDPPSTASPPRRARAGRARSSAASRACARCSSTRRRSRGWAIIGHRIRITQTTASKLRFAAELGEHDA